MDSNLKVLDKSARRIAQLERHIEISLKMVEPLNLGLVT